MPAVIALRRALGPLLAAMIAMSWLLPGCGDEAPKAADALCAADAACGEGLSCHALGVCVAPPHNEAPLLLRLQPAQDSGYVAEHFHTTVAQSASAPPKWMLTEPAVLRGRVVRLDGSQVLGGGSVPGKLVAQTDTELAGVNLRYEARVSAALRVDDDSASVPYAFALRVQPGYAYQVSFWPDAATLPPMHVTQTLGASKDNLELVLPADKTLVHIHGRLVSRGGVGECSTAGAGYPDPRAPLPACEAPACHPLPGVRLGLVDADGRLRSTRVVTDEDGAFDVVADPSLAQGWLHLEPASDDPLLPYGKLAAPIDVAKAAIEGVDRAVGEVDVGAMSAAVQTSLIVRDAAGSPVAGAFVRVRRPLQPPPACDAEGEPVGAGGEGHGETISGAFLEASGYTDLDGKLGFAMSPGVATVGVLPPAGHAAGRWTATEVSIAGDALEVVCPTRQRLDGVLRDRHGEPLTVGTVRVRWLGHEGHDHVADDLDLHVVDAVGAPVDAQGRFSLSVDPGDYVAWYDPPAGAGLARTLLATPTVDAQMPPAAVEATIHAPSVLSGVVLDAAQQPLEEVVVDVLAIAPGSGAPGLDPHQLRNLDAPGLTVYDTHRLATGVTGAQGRFELLVSPPDVTP